MKLPFFQPENPLHAIGYKADQEGIMNRCIREKNNWKEHLKNTSEYIIKFCELLPPDSSIAILGSGWLLDVPIDYLLKKFHRIYLVDMCHPIQVKHKYKDKPNIIFVEKDLTGYAAEVVRIAANPKPGDIINALMNLQYVNVLADIECDALLSVNILTQLDSLLCDYVSSKNYFPAEQLNNFKKKIQAEHLKLLSTKPSCLISDVEEVFLQRNNTVAFTSDTIKVDWPQGSHSKAWNWIFDSKYMYDPRYKTNLSVKAVMLLQASP